MTLDEYLTMHGETGKDFAQRLGIAPSTITRLRNGETWPDRVTAKAIFNATQGLVSSDYFLDGEVASE